MKPGKLKDMSIDKEAPTTMGVPFALGEYTEKYPCGLSISLGDAELKKLGLTDDCEVGEFIHLFAFAKVTSVSKHDSEGGGEHNSVCLQITHLATESEDEEDEEEDAEEEGEEEEKEEKPAGKKRRSLYF